MLKNFNKEEQIQDKILLFMNIVKSNIVSIDWLKKTLNIDDEDYKFYIRTQRESKLKRLEKYGQQ